MGLAHPADATRLDATLASIIDGQTFPRLDWQSLTAGQIVAIIDAAGGA